MKNTKEETMTTVNINRQNKPKPYLKLILTTIITTSMLSACNQKNPEMHLTGESYIHKDLSEEPYYSEEIKKGGAVSTAQKNSYTGYVFDNKTLGFNLAEDTGGSSTSVIQNAISTGTLYFPLASGTFTSHAGPRVHPKDGVYKWHAGMDIAATMGTPIQAAHDGRVVFSGMGPGGYGYAIEIEATMDGTQFSTYYAHMMMPSRLRVGDNVKKGDNIGSVGNTGVGTGAHLHLEVRMKDPMQLLVNKEYSSSDLVTAKKDWWYGKGWSMMNPVNYFDEVSKTTPAYTVLKRKN